MDGRASARTRDGLVTLDGPPPVRSCASGAPLGGLARRRGGRRGRGALRLELVGHSLAGAVGDVPDAVLDCVADPLDPGIFPDTGHQLVELRLALLVRLAGEPVARS